MNTVKITGTNGEMAIFSADSNNLTYNLRFVNNPNVPDIEKEKIVIQFESFGEVDKEKFYSYYSEVRKLGELEKIEFFRFVEIVQEDRLLFSTSDLNKKPVLYILDERENSENESSLINLNFALLDEE